MVKTLQKSSSPEPAGRFSRNYSNDDPRVTLTYITTRSNLETYAFLWEKVKTVDFSETIEACDLKVGRYKQLNDFMKVCKY